MEPMSSEPKKPIEELLEASARARRAEFGAAPKMPNPMRTRLHDEIARLSRAEEPKERSSWLTTWWPRLATTTAVAAVLIGASLVWSWRDSQPGNQSLHIAAREPAAANDAKETQSETTSQKGSAAPAPMPSFSDATTAGSQSLATARTDSTDSNALKKSEETTVTPSVSETANPADESRLLAERSRSTSAPNKNIQSPAPAPASASVAQNRANFRQQFSPSSANQTFRSNAKFKQQVANVLNTFQIEQNGAHLRVVDADGSTYTGNIEPRGQTSNAPQSQETSVTSKKTKSYTARSEQPAPTPAPRNESVGSEFYFRTAGYNSSLGKSVVFEGSYIISRDAQQNRAGTSPSNVGDQTARIVGTARIHGESPVPVDAVSVSP
jgi:hypothetical protein